MKEDIEILKDKLKKKLENYELDKKIGQLSVDSIYSLFPNESKTLLDYIEQLQNNWNELKKWLENLQEYYISMKDKYDYSEEYKYAKDVLNKMQELEGNNE